MGKEKTMNKRILLVLAATALLLSAVMLNKANPIVEGFFNELFFDSAGWRLEVHVQGTATLDGWYLKSRSGQAYFKNGIQLTGVYRVITPESLLSPLAINRLGDSITLHSPQSPRASLYFGSGLMVAAPRDGQSMCLRESGSQFYYLDNTPTLGQPNDALNAMGIVRGHIADSLGQPIPGVLVSWGEPLPLVYSDSAGNFSVTEYARRVSLSFTHAHFATRYVTVQIWPESTVVIGVTLDRIVGVEWRGVSTAPVFELQANYPNPFNPSTTISYRLPARSHVMLKVFDVSGREIATLANGVEEPGYKSVPWDANGVVSGVYFYRLQAGDFVQTRKLLLLR
jgi:hypothetical protein